MSDNNKKPIFNDKQIQFFRDDLESDMGYTKIIMISELATKLKNKGKSNKKIMKEIIKFRKKHRWGT